MILKRWFDLLFSFIGLIFLLPFFLVISCVIVFDSNGGVFYLQNRVGLNGDLFKLIKFRTMYISSEKKGLLTVGIKDSRITKFGFYLRKYKLDELPQLINVLLGKMSFVGPRPEVEKYVALYSFSQKRVLNVKPGITDIASIYYKNENEILSEQVEPELFYTEKVMPHKIRLNNIYINNQNICYDFIIILKTINSIIK